jgi:hypothetical protein
VPAAPKSENNMKAQSLFLVCLLFTNLLRGQDSPIHITVAAGEGASHNIYQKFRVQPVVLVADENDKPIQGATVVFTLPAKGPGGTFEHNRQTLTINSDATGRAGAYGIRLNKKTGPFAIQVTATYQGQTASASIAQTSIAGTKKSQGAFGISTRTWVLLGLGAVVIAGAIVAAHNLKSGRDPNVLVAAPGVPTVGGPQ